MTELNTTREEREKYLSKTDSWSSYSDALARDCNTLEDELARVRDELKKTYAKMMLNHDAAVNAEHQLEKLRMTQKQAENIEQRSNKEWWDQS